MAIKCDRQCPGKETGQTFSDSEGFRKLLTNEHW